MTKQAPLKLEQLETMIYSGDHRQAGSALLTVFYDIENKGISIVPDKQAEGGAHEHEHEQLQLNTRLAACITTLMANKSFSLSQQGYELYIVFKRFMHAVFMASGFGDMNHLLWQISEQDNHGKHQVRGDGALRKLLLVVSPDSPQEKLQYDAWVTSLPLHLSLPFWLSFVDAEIVISRQAAQARKRIALLCDNITVPDNYQLPNSMISRLSNAWMLCSYMDFPQKHRIKPFLNRLIRRFGDQNGVKAPTITSRPAGTASDKPRLLIASEHFSSFHAMHRCYRPAIDSLKTYFHTVCLCRDDTIDETGRESFDEVHTFKSGESIRKIAGMVIKARPDAIYYPSLGMQDWTLILAQYRFAPIQFMTLGHPATSMSPVIDYALTGETDPDLFSEKIVLSRKKVKFDHSLHPQGQDFTRQRQDTRRVRIAVNAKLYKINYQLIEACQAIKERSNKPVDFVFFPACKGIIYEAFNRELNRHLEAKVYPGTSYPVFIDRLRACDMVLNPFPFGNTNGINDCARIGLPFVCMDGKEPHSHVDVLMSEQLGYPAFLRTKTLEEYIEAGVRLVNDDDLREGIIKETVERQAADRITGPKASESQFGSTVYKLFLLHPELQQSANRVVDMDVLELPETQAQA